MPIDYKRINGPEITIPYQLFEKLNTKTLKTQFADIVNADGTRRGDAAGVSRKADESRKISLMSSVIGHAKGSAYIELGETKVIASVFDPREIPNKTDYSSKGEIYCEFKFAPFSCRKRRLHQQDAEEEQYSAIMKQALEPAVLRHEFPNFQVDVYALVLHNDGSALSAAITAAGVALANAGIPMYDLVISKTLGVQGSFQLLDPNLEEERLCEVPLYKEEKNTEHGIIVMTILASSGQVSQFYQSGNFSFDTLRSGMEVLENAKETDVLLIKKALVRQVIADTSDVEH